jgi:hypothetical protein
MRAIRVVVTQELIHVDAGALHKHEFRNTWRGTCSLSQAGIGAMQLVSGAAVYRDLWRLPAVVGTHLQNREGEDAFGS